MESTEDIDPRKIRHPFYGFVPNSPGIILNAMPPRPRREDTVIIGLLGGSVAGQVKPYLQVALNRWFAANQLPRRPVVLDLAGGNVKQPQQTLIVANILLLGGEFDLLVNLDGVNEMTAVQGIGEGILPFFPLNWSHWVGLTGAENLLAGHIGVLRREQARLTALRETSPLRGSALWGLLNRYQRERAAAVIIRRNQQLATAAANYNLEKHGPRSWLATERELRPAAARFWYRGSVTLARLAELAGADYYHFLQPNQYVSDSKPLSPEEWASAYGGGYQSVVEQGYPLLREFNQDLPRQGINYFDLTGIFVDHPETLYVDDCCHLNARGNELLAAAMVQRLTPALVRRGQENPDESVSALAAARRPAGPPPAAAPGFQVSVTEDGKELRYVRAGCFPEDTEPGFYLHIVPEVIADLPPQDWERGFENRDFSFAAAGGRFERWQCTAQRKLPDYPIAALKTGQYVPGQGSLWSVELVAPADPEELRAIYAALSPAEPVARSYFDLYALDSRLIYLRENCAAADTAAYFFLHIIPEDPADLPEYRRKAGFAYAGFAFVRQGGHFDGKCLAAVALPDYPIKEIRTGQHIPGQGHLWLVELFAADAPDKLRAIYAALADMEPVARDYFELYVQDYRLIYLRETCAAADTEAPFFLQIVPENVADLPEEWRAGGLGYGDFHFIRRGGHFDGKCLATVALPHYPVKEIRTGQHIPGQGAPLWLVKLTDAP